MNRLNAGAPSPRRARTFAYGLLALLAVAALAAVAVAVALRPSVLAQTPPAPKAQPKAQPKAKTPPQPAPAPPAAAANTPAAPEIPPLTFTPWTRVCAKGQEADAKTVCATGREGRLDNGFLVIGAVLIEPEGIPQKLLRITLPLGMALQAGTRVIVDQGQPMNAPFVVCLPNGCMADIEASAELVGELKKGQGLVVQAIHMQRGALTLNVPLAEFAKANQGPPMDQKTYEERQRKLEEEYAKKAQQLQQQGH
jgi:invasion protein IalB